MPTPRPNPCDRPYWHPASGRHWRPAVSPFYRSIPALPDLDRTVVHHRLGGRAPVCGDVPKALPHPARIDVWRIEQDLREARARLATLQQQRARGDVGAGDVQAAQSTVSQLIGKLAAFRR